MADDDDLLRPKPTGMELAVRKWAQSQPHDKPTTEAELKIKQAIEKGMSEYVKRLKEEGDKG